MGAMVERKERVWRREILFVVIMARICSVRNKGEKIIKE